jgi:phospholipase/carboxylesterase
MNRLVLDAEKILPSDSLPSFCDSHDLATLENHRARQLELSPHATFAPMHYEANYAYPLIVWLHGNGSNEHELRQIMPQVSMRNYVAAAPQGSWQDTRNRGRYGWRQTSDMIEEAESRVLDCIANARRRFNIHANRVFLAGHGAGGTMAVRIAWNNPAEFAGVAAFNGPLPSRQSPLRRVNELRHLPCLLATTRDSKTYPQNHVCDDLRLLHAAGCTVAMRQYPGPDALTKRMFDDLNRWLMDIVCGTKSAELPS